MYRIGWCSPQKRSCLHKTNIFQELRPYFGMFFSNATKYCNNFLAIRYTETNASTCILFTVSNKNYLAYGLYQYLKIPSPKKNCFQMVHNWPTLRQRFFVSLECQQNLSFIEPSTLMGEAEYFSHNRSIVRGQIIGNRRQLDGLYDFLQ